MLWGGAFGLHRIRTSATMDEKLPSLSANAQAALKDVLVDKLTDMDLYTGMLRPRVPGLAREVPESGDATGPLIASRISMACQAGCGGLVCETLLPTLTDLRALFADDVLPEYIMVMVKNRKAPNEIAEQLEFFVGDQTKDFVQWCVSLRSPPFAACMQSLWLSAVALTTASVCSHPPGSGCTR